MQDNIQVLLFVAAALGFSVIAATFAAVEHHSIAVFQRIRAFVREAGPGIRVKIARGGNG